MRHPSMVIGYFAKWVTQKVSLIPEMAIAYQNYLIFMVLTVSAYIGLRTLDGPHQQVC